MPEVSKPVQMVVIEYVCDKCKSGTMEKHGEIEISYLTYPIKIPHKCNNCEAVQYFTEPAYPRIAYKEINGDLDEPRTN